MSWRTLGAFGLAMLGWANAYALEGPPVVGDPHGGHPTWLTAHPEAQAARDKQVPPAATGAIFVPAMTHTNAEPRYIVRKDGKDLIARKIGQKAWVVPGTYRVLVGSGGPSSMLEFEVQVIEGRTTYVPVEWSGLVVNVVNERGTPFRGNYEVVRMPQREFIGLGLGADIAQGEALDTWLLRPGKVMILAAGESYQARKNFVTLRLPPGELVRYTVVLQEATGDLLGAGEISDDQPRKAGPWYINMSVGGSFQFARSDSVIGKSDGMTLDISAFLEAVGGYRGERHVGYARLYIEEEGTIRLPDEPYLSLVDTLDLDLLYAFKVVPWFGPYGRFSLETQMVPGIIDFDVPTDVLKHDSRGNELFVESGVSDTVLTPPFAPIDLRYGVGGRFDLSPVYWFDFKSRVGVGGRHVFARNLYIIDDFDDTPELDLFQVDDLTQFGAEMSLVLGVQLGRWVQLDAEFDMLLPFDDAEHPVVDFRTTIALRLASFATLNYTLRIQEDIQLTPDTQFDQAVLLRFAYKIL